MIPSVHQIGDERYQVGGALADRGHHLQDGVRDRRGRRHDLGNDQLFRRLALFGNLRDKKKWGEDPNPLDAFGRRKPYTLGIPHGDNGHQLVDLSPELALHIIEAHISRKQSELVEACARAALELSGDLPAKTEAA